MFVYISISCCHLSMFVRIFQISMHQSWLLPNIHTLIRVISKYPYIGLRYFSKYPCLRIWLISNNHVFVKVIACQIYMLRYLKLLDIHIYIIFVARYPSFCLLFCHISMFEPYVL